MVFKLDSIREGVTDFGRTTIPRETPYEMRAVAGETLCFSAILIKAGSFDNGEPGSQRMFSISGRLRTSGSERRVGLDEDTLFVAVLLELVLRVVRVVLDLVDGRDNLPCL